MHSGSGMLFLVVPTTAPRSRPGWVMDFGSSQQWPCSCGSSGVRAGCRLPQLLCSPLQWRKPRLWCSLSHTTVRSERTEAPAGVGRTDFILWSPQYTRPAPNCGLGLCLSWSSTQHGQKEKGEGEGTLTCISADVSLGTCLKQTVLLKRELLLADFWCRQEREFTNLPVIAALRRGFHLAACCIIQPAKCGFKSQYCPCPWPEERRQWLGLFASVFIKGLIGYMRLNFTPGIFSMGFLVKLILLSNKYLQF